MFFSLLSNGLPEVIEMIDEMTEVVTREEYPLTGMERLDEKAFWEYLDWQRGSRRIASKVKTPFEESLFEETGYSDQNRPEEEIWHDIQIGRKTFRVKTKPTTKTPAYKEVITGFSQYVDFLLEQREEEDALRRGVRRLDENLYVDLGVLEDKLERDKSASLSGKEGVEQGVLGIVRAANTLVKKGTAPTLSP